MNNDKNSSLGIVFRPEYPPEELPGFARRAEEAGFDELWLWEDCFFAGGIASAATALAATEHISVGLGIMPAVARNPAFAAMEIAALARFHPGRFLPGIGHGVAAWMRQIGAFPKSQLAALGEVALTVREIVAGRHVSFDGKYVHLEGIELEHPPNQIPPISLGVRGPKSLALSGRIADGTILADYAAPAYVSWAREQITNGQQEAAIDRDHRVTVFAMTCPGETTAEAREEARPFVAWALSTGHIDAQIEPMGILPQVNQLRQSGDAAHIAAAIPDAWIDQLAIVGTKEDWMAAVDRYVEAGANSIVFVPAPDKGPQELERFRRHLAG